MDYKDVFKLPRTEFNAYVAQYDKKVDELNEHIQKMISRLPNFDNIIPIESRVLRYLSRNKLNDHSAAYVPKFKEGVALRKTTGCETAFFSETPLRIVLTKEFSEKMTDVGLLFVLFHEAQHFYRRHQNRKQERDHMIWNIAGDLIINYDLQYRKLPKLLNGMTKGEINVSTVDKYDFYKDENDAHKGGFIGDEYPIDDPTGIYMDTSHWFKDYMYDGKYNEEEIYDIVKKEMQQQQKEAPNAEDHIKDGKEINDEFERQQGQSQQFEEEFGEYTDEMQDAYEKAKKEFGAPQTKEQEREMKDAAKQIAEQINNEVKQQQQGYGTSDMETSIKREREIKEKTRFSMFLTSVVNSKQKTGRWVQTNEANKLSRLTRIDSIPEMLGHKNALMLKKKERESVSTEILVIIDTSGSVSFDDYQQYFAEMKSAVMAGATLHCVPADTEAKTDSRFIVDKNNYDKYAKNGFPMVGGGGTDMLTPLTKELVYSKNLEKTGYDAAIVLSDGGFEAFSKDEFMERINYFVEEYGKEPDSKNKHQNVNRLKRNQEQYNGITAPRQPPVIILNTQEMMYSSDNKFNTFKRGELQEFVLNKENTVTIRNTHGRKLSR